MSPAEPPRIDVRPVDGVAVVRFRNADILYEEAAVSTLGDGLLALLRTGGHTRLVLNFDGVRYICSSMLARLLDLERKVRQAGGRLRLCSLGPTVRDVLVTGHVDRVFDIVDDEVAALAGFRP